MGRHRFGGGNALPGRIMRSRNAFNSDEVLVSVVSLSERCSFRHLPVVVTIAGL
jgi:hypothetical protein